MSTLLTKIAADFTTQLNTALSVGGTEATLLSQTDDDGVTLPDGNYTFTLDGASSNKEHIRCVKTGTSLTSIQSLSRQGALTTGVVRAHRIGCSVVITDWAQLKYLTDILVGDSDLDATNPLKYDGAATLTPGSNELATVVYAESLANQGAANASTSVKGISKISVAAVDGNDPIVVGDNDPRVPTQGENDALTGTSGSPSSTNKYVTNDDTSVTAAASKVVRANSNGLIDSSFLESIYFGDGSDGDATITTNSSLSRDMYYDNLTINTGVVLNPSGYRIFVKGILTTVGTGKIARDGNAGSIGTSGVGGAGGTALAAGTIAGGVAGGQGGFSTAGANGTSVTNSIGSTTSAGNGGTAGGGAYTGGSGGTSTVANPTIITPKLPIQLNAINVFNVTGLFNNSGSGAGGGSSSNNGGYRGGGGGGGAGGIVAISANSIVLTATDSISAKGGAGGNGATSALGDGGGGGGGNGGVIILVYKSISGTSLVAATACAGGAKGLKGAGGSASATDGTDGAIGAIYSYQI